MKFPWLLQTSAAVCRSINHCDLEGPQVHTMCRLCADYLSGPILSCLSLERMSIRGAVKPISMRAQSPNFPPSKACKITRKGMPKLGCAPLPRCQFSLHALQPKQLRIQKRMTTQVYDMQGRGLSLQNAALYGFPVPMYAAC